MTNKIPLLKYKIPENAVENLEEAMATLKSTKELSEPQIDSIEEDLNWLMDEHSEIFRSEKKEAIRKGLENLREDQKGKTAYGILKITKREFHSEFKSDEEEIER